ncbi:MAG: hypothetical protein ACPG3X_05640, partial [Opitutales bacterium]
RAAACRMPSHRGLHSQHDAFRNDFVDPLRKRLPRPSSLLRAMPDTVRLRSTPSYGTHRSGNANAVPTAGTRPFGTTSSIRYEKGFTVRSVLCASIRLIVAPD